MPLRPSTIPARMKVRRLRMQRQRASTSEASSDGARPRHSPADVDTSQEGNDAMKVAFCAQRLGSAAVMLAAVACLSQAGCIMGSTRAVPAARLPDIYQAEHRCDKVPINLTLLRQ